MQEEVTQKTLALCVEAGKVHQGAGATAVLQEHVLQGQVCAGDTGAVKLQILVSIGSDLPVRVNGHAIARDGHRVGGADGDGAGSDVLGQGIIAACGDGVSALELCIARRVLCPGHIGDGGQQTDDHGQSQQQRQDFLIDLLHRLFPSFVFSFFSETGRMLRTGSGLRTLCSLSRTGQETPGRTAVRRCRSAGGTAGFGQWKAAETRTVYTYLF